MQATGLMFHISFFFAIQCSIYHVLHHV